MFLRAQTNYVAAKRYSEIRKEEKIILSYNMKELETHLQQIDDIAENQ